MATPSPWVRRFATRIRPGGRVLDVAAGAGRHTRWLRDQGYRVTAIDVDVSKLADLANDPAVELLEADLETGEWPLPGRTFDGVVVTNYLHRPLLLALVDALARGGVLIYETFGEGNERYGRPSNPDYLLREGELLDTYEGRLDIVAFEHVTETDPRPAVRQRICATLSEDAAEAPERHSHAPDGTQAE